MGIVGYVFHHLSIVNAYRHKKNTWKGGAWFELKDGTNGHLERRQGVYWHLEDGRTVMSHEIDRVMDRHDCGYN